MSGGPEASWLAARPDVNTTSMERFTVAGVGEDTVNLAYGDALILEVPCSEAYFNRARGDEVWVQVKPGSMYVTGKAGEAFTGNFDWNSITNKPDLAGITWGDTDPPGTGWVPIVEGSLWAKGNAFYGKRADGGTGGGGDPGGAGVPDPHTVDRDKITDALYQSGHRTTAINSGMAVQGSWPGYPENRGAWFYGSAITDACAGKTVADMTIRLRRRNRGGLRGGVPVHLYLIDAGSPPRSTPSMSNKWNPGKLQRAEVFHLTGPTAVHMPADWVSALASGSARGIGCMSGPGQDYIIFGACGQVRITYK